MKTQARVVVVGGGAVGVGVLYHLAKAGWSDVVLIERNELTDGSTWHAAGLLPLFNVSYSVGQLHKYSVDLYKTLEAETGQDVGFHVVGNLRLANTSERMDEYKYYLSTADTIGVECQVLTPKQVKDLWPLCNTDGLVGAIYHPTDGHIAPADLTMALAKGARNRGAEIYRQTLVTGFTQAPSGDWIVHTDKGDITCEHVISATGNYGRQTLAMVGVDIPVIPVEHQFLITEEIPELVERKAQGLPEMPILRESDCQYYMREERQGLLLGPYEKGAPAWAVDGVPEGFGRELLQPDIERLEPHIEGAINRVPVFGTAGIKDAINGPIAYTPDGSPMVGPAYGLRNFWMSEGHSFGITAAGGAGHYLANWIIDGDPGIDLASVDSRRFGPYANKAYTKAKNEEAYNHVFILHYPAEERPACRPAKTTPSYLRQDQMGAVWGQKYGWERANWFAPEGVERKDEYSFRRGNWFPHVGAECRAVRERVGVIDMSTFTKWHVTGPGAEAYLDRLVANRLPKTVGRINLCHALTVTGTVRSEFTIVRDGPDAFYVVHSGASEMYDGHLLHRELPTDGSVRLDNVTGRYGVLLVTGPHARDVLARLTSADLSSKAHPWLSSRTIDVGLAPGVRAMRVSYVGELGWELHHPIEYQLHLYDALFDAGRAFGIAPVGMRAMDSLRLEKTYRAWGTDLNRENSALEAGLHRFVHLNKGEFRGRDALVRQQEAGVPNQLVTLKVAVNGADPLGNEPVFSDGRVIGRATSGGYAHWLDHGIVLAYVKPDFAAVGTPLEVAVLRDKRPAEVLPESPHDPDNVRLRA